MRRLRYLLPFLLFVTSLSFGQTVTVTADLKTLFGVSQVNNAKVCFSLIDGQGNPIQDPRVSGSLLINTANVCAVPDGAGHISTQIEPNDLITPIGSQYAVEEILNGQFIHGDNFTFSSGSSYNLNTMTPNASVAIPAAPQPSFGSQSAVCTFPFAVSTWICTENMGTTQVISEFFDATGKQIFPDSAQATDLNTFTGTWVAPQAGSMKVVNVGNWTPSALFPNYIISNPSAPQTITGQGLTLSASAPLTSAGQTNIASLNQVLYVGSCTGCYAHISTAIAALGGGTPNLGTIEVMDNYTDAITTTLQIGWLPTQVAFPTGIKVIMHPGSAIQVGVTNGTAGVIIADGSSLECAGATFSGDENGHTSTCQVYTKDNSVNVSCLICSQSNATPAVNTFQDTMSVQGITALCNAGTWNICVDVGAVGAPSSFAYNTFFAGGGTGSCLLKLHNGTGGGMALIDNELRGGGISGVTPLCITGGEATGYQGVTGEILFDGGEISCMGSTSPAISINGDAGGVHQIGVEQIWVRGVHSQTGGGCGISTTSPYITIINGSFIHFFETQLSISGTYVFQLSETAGFKTNALILDNVDIGCGNSTCAGESLINDTVMGVVHAIPGNVKSVSNGGFLAYVMHDEAGHMGDSTYGASIYTMLATGCLNWGSSVFLGKGNQTGEVRAGSTCGGTDGQFSADKFVNQNDKARLDSNGVYISNNVAFGFSSTTAASGSRDGGFSRIAPAVVGLGQSSAGDTTGTLQLSRLKAGSLVPTCTFTSGGGTSPSCAVDTGSSDSAGIIVATTGTGTPALTGTITLTFSSGTAFGTNKPSCIYMASNNGAGQWGSLAAFSDKTPATTTDLFNWTNATGATPAGVALSTSTAYWINYHCWAK